MLRHYCTHATPVVLQWSGRRKKLMRKCGVLLPVFSLPSDGGTGGFGKYAYEFIDALAEAGQSYWQVLPLNPVGRALSPYSSPSCFAGDTRYLSSDSSAAGSLPEASEAEFEAYCKGCSDWLDDYALFQALKGKFGGSHWYEWPDSLKYREGSALQRARLELAEEIRDVKLSQFIFDREWKALKRYANERAVEIIGDTPIYVSYDSADCWSHPEIFQLDENLVPLLVSGCPPDYFNPDGQVWKNPLYDWDKLRDTGYAWWSARMKRCFELYDILRIDHTRGLESFFAIPSDTMCAADGRWFKGPGMEFFRAVRAAVGDDCRLIAEDLGFITDEVRSMIEESGCPGMKVLQFAFDGNPGNPYLPDNIQENSVAYTGTHDNDTTAGWYRSLDRNALNLVNEYLRGRPHIIEEVDDAVDAMVAEALNSRAETCIIPMQDYLRLDGTCRVNTPGTVEGNWTWKMDSPLSEEVRERMLALALRSGRINRKDVI